MHNVDLIAAYSWLPSRLMHERRRKYLDQPRDTHNAQTMLRCYDDTMLRLRRLHRRRHRTVYAQNRRVAPNKETPLSPRFFHNGAARSVSSRRYKRAARMCIRIQRHSETNRPKTGWTVAKNASVENI